MYFMGSIIYFAILVEVVCCGFILVGVYELLIIALCRDAVSYPYYCVLLDVVSFCTDH